MIQDLVFPCITILNCSNLLVCIWNPAWPVFGAGRIFMAGLVFRFGFGFGILVLARRLVLRICWLGEWRSRIIHCCLFCCVGRCLLYKCMYVSDVSLVER
ncbi:hypothetical protein BJX66DRAFT_308903 [Aspergillus keveii]|uniref:Uncharacterized protein n=1 Tax=Aspergillus keveii TaxID=714993 RepID=A0ABR4FZX0_9EURO